MEDKNKRYLISQSECECSLVDFYENAAKNMGVHIAKETQYDCRKICVTKPVQDCIWKYYSDAGRSDEEIAAYLLRCGPKANLTGDSLEFEAEDGFVAGNE